MSVKIIFSLFLILNFVRTFSQDDELEILLEFDTTMIGETWCDTYKNMAKKHIENGYYACFIGGLNGSSSNTFQRLMFRKYGIHAVFTGSCTGGYMEDCYSAITYPVIIEKFGADIFTQTAREADSLDKIGKGDRRLYYYYEGKKMLNKIFYQEFDHNLIKQYSHKDQFPNPLITLYVNEDGIIYNFKISPCENIEVKEEIKRIIPILPDLVYATNNGQPVADSIKFRLPINRKERRKN